MPHLSSPQCHSTLWALPLSTMLLLAGQGLKGQSE